MAFDEVGQADTAERKVAICERAYRLLLDRRVRAATTSSSIRTSSRSRPGSTSIAATRSTSSRRPARSAAAAPARTFPAASRTSAFRSAATSRCAARCTASSSITRSPRGWTWASSTPASSTSMTRSTPSCARRAKTSILDRRDDATERLVELAERFKGTDAAEEKKLAEWRALPVDRASVLCAGQGHRRAYRRRHRGSAPAVRRDRSR